MTKKLRYLLGTTRILIGFIFFWAFLDKTFGLGYATEPDSSWISGGSPTEGFLRHGTSGGLFEETFQSLAGAVWVDWLFMIGLLGIGAALILGIAMRIAVVSGVVMLVLMWLALLPLENNPLIDDHIIYSFILLALLASDEVQALGFGQQWKELEIVQKYQILK